MKFQIKITQRLLDGFWILVAQIQALDEICSFPAFFRLNCFKKSVQKHNNVTTKLTNTKLTNYVIRQFGSHVVVFLN